MKGKNKMNYKDIEKLYNETNPKKVSVGFIEYKYLILINANNTLTKHYYTNYKLAYEFYKVAINNFGEDKVTIEIIN